MSKKLQYFIENLSHLSPNISFLYDMIEEIENEKQKEKVVVPIFNYFEKYPDADLGSPGPLVHFLESIEFYQEELQNSLKRKPTAHTCWMVNRILNSNLEKKQREKWLNFLRLSVQHPEITEETILVAKNFLEYQE
ncbi:hypothetical protein [Candidatus Uabimicrobium sp. HlEnr_7]|uniref:hypothetical protein n=1 Tax=Candidatus Uabimicrobium helgolandensis TaxID=3095367 RepID=UPI00355651C5